MIVDKQGHGSAYGKVGRSASASSGDFSSDGRDGGQHSPVTLRPFTDKPATDHATSSESKSKKGGAFFDTLDWQDSSQAAVTAASSGAADLKKTDRVRQLAAFEIASTSLDEEFADFSVSRLSTNTNVTDALSEVAEPEHIGDQSNGDTAMADLLSGYAWTGSEAGKDLFDVGAPEPTNFDLLVGPTPLGNTNGNSSSGVDLLNSDQTFVADFSTHTESSNNPFSIQDAGTVDDNSTLTDMAANLFGTFDPFTGASADEKSTSSCNKLSKPDSQTVDFLSYLENTSTTGSGRDDGPDLMGGWNASNILSGVNVSMPRASSRPDFGSGASGVQNSVPRASSSQNMSSKSFGMTNGSSRNTIAADPFAEIGWFILIYKLPRVMHFTNFS